MASAYDKCARCGVSMIHALGRGKARKYCGHVCQHSADTERKAARAFATCCVEGCDAPANRVGAGMCEAHYMRVRRHHSTDKRSNAKPGVLEHSGGYRLEPAPEHPRALGGYRAYQHRVVFTEAHGEGPFNCYHCGAKVTWEDMHVDHLDDDKANNRIDNLVASCPPCNQQRGAHKMRKTMKAKGRALSAHGKTMCLSDWARHLGLSRSTIDRRIAAGLTLEAALISDRAPTGPARKRQPIPGYVVDVHVRQVAAA